MDPVELRIHNDAQNDQFLASRFRLVISLIV